MRKFEINWKIVFWTGVIVIFLWILAKKAGLFNTPLIIEIIPYIGGIIVILAIVKEMGKTINKLDNTISDIKEMKTEIKNIGCELHNLDKRVAVLETRI
ncbi:hypothetical protein J4440_02855 [Candidatus Woesearchaeota archaeon]|nr:hypothetical protein [Candidatus Woesearchaeota archaeon]